MTILIRGGRIIDPANGVDAEGDLAIDGNQIVDPSSIGTPDEIVDATGRLVCPGFIDLHASLREPGFEEDETTRTGAAAAVAGGFTTVCTMPDTEPAVDNRGAAEFILLQAARAGLARVIPLGAVTKNRDGHELAEIGQLVEGGAVAFTDGHRPVANAEIMRRALEYTRMFDRPIFNLPQVPELVEKGVMHEGYHSTLIGLRGMPAAAQDIMVGRDLALADVTDGRIHLMCLSTRDSIDQVRRARAIGLKVTCDVTPHHLVLQDECMRKFDAHYKVDPPLRTQQHIDALLEGLKDGTIDAITSDHQPYAQEKKQVELDLAPFGISGLETVLPICATHLVHAGHLSWTELIAKLTTGPARVLGLEIGTLSIGSMADVTLIDPDVDWQINAEAFYSRGRNSPFDGHAVRGRVASVWVAGRRVLADGQLQESGPRVARL